MSCVKTFIVQSNRYMSCSVILHSLGDPWPELLRRSAQVGSPKLCSITNIYIPNRLNNNHNVMWFMYRNDIVRGLVYTAISHGLMEAKRMLPNIWVFEDRYCWNAHWPIKSFFTRIRIKTNSEIVYVNCYEKKVDGALAIVWHNLLRYPLSD